VISLLKANAAKDCPFFFLHQGQKCAPILGRPNVQRYMWTLLFHEGKLEIQTELCDQLAGWASFTHEIFGFDPNTCSSHITGRLWHELARSADKIFELLYLKNFVDS
jgi:hypothetical protein